MLEALHFRFQLRVSLLEKLDGAFEFLEALRIRFGFGSRGVAGKDDETKEATRKASGDAVVVRFGGW
jgi:hypothetical protein